MLISRSGFYQIGDALINAGNSLHPNKGLDCVSRHSAKTMTPLSPHSRKGLSLQLGRVSGLDAAFSTDGLKQLVLVVETPAGTYSTASSPMGVWSEQIIVGFSEVTFKLVEPSRIDKGSATIVGKLVASRKYMYFYDFGVEVAVQLFDEDEPLDAQLFVCPAVSHDPPSKTCSLIIDATLPPVTWIPSQELRLSRADHFLNIAWRKPHSPHEPEQNAALPPSAAQPVSLAANRPQSPLRSISPTNPVMGSIELELVGAINVAMIPRSFGKGLKLNAFVVVSFGRDSFRTSIGRVASRCSADGTALVIWKQRAHFSVKSPAESHYVLSMAVYHRERLQPNRLLGRCQIGAGRLTGNPETRLSLSCRLDDGRPSLLLKAAFTPYNALRRNFWFVLARNFACDPDGTRLNRLGAETMLESLGSAFAPLDELFRGREEMRVDALVDALEEYTIERCSQCMLVSMERCPLCRTSFSGGRFSGDKTSSRNIDIITHLAVCTTRSQHDSPYKVERLMMAGFLTEEYASRKWFVRLLSYMSFGNYRIGSNNGNIFVHDRATGKLVEERIPTYIRLGIRLVFQASRVGRALSSATLRILPESVAELRMARSLCASLTLKQGRRFTDPASLSHIPEFIKYHGINLAEIADPIDSYANFNEFFYRRLKPGARQLADASERVAVSPCDCRINVYATVSEATVFWYAALHCGWTLGSKGRRLRLRLFWETRRWRRAIATARWPSAASPRRTTTASTHPSTASSTLSTPFPAPTSPSTRWLSEAPSTSSPKMCAACTRSRTPHSAP